MEGNSDARAVIQLVFVVERAKLGSMVPLRNQKDLG
jgi:hypothetical protein